MRSRHFIHSVLLMLCFNSLVLLIAACMKTIPAETVNLEGRLSRAPLQKIPVLQNDYSSHVEQFRAAKLFRASVSTESKSEKAEAFASAESASQSRETSTEVRTFARREGITKNAKIFAAKIDERSETPNKEEEEVTQPEPVIVPTRDDNKVHDDRDLFEALQVEKPDICGSCPPIWMKNNAEMKDVCSNYESVSTFFSMTMDKRDAKNIIDRSDVKECTRTITCSEPHMLVKWHESDLCDVHAPSSGSLVTDSTNTFVYKCNGTHWTLHGFPLSSVVCAVSAN
ncbi:unnamed protein product [Caenorhabditis sp. 36 PRJEB53466]|nr:unnamed protein product [Caenorhabditis sp. 36 PRJEB53466]